MSIVARVFVVLNLILSIAFLIFAMQIWTAKTKWQKMYEKERGANIDIKSKNQVKNIELETRQVQLEGVIQKRNQRIYSLIMEQDRIRDELLKINEQLAKESSKVEMWQALNEELMRENSRRADELVKLKGVLLKQQQAVQVARDNEAKALNEKAELETELNQTRQTLAAIRKDKRRVEEDLALQTRRIMGLLERGVPIPEILGEDPQATQPYIPDAQVLAVKPDLNLVMISVGSAQGVKPGFRLTISRDDKYIGVCQVERVYPDMCSARMLPELTTGLVQKHDAAKSRVYNGGVN